VKLTDPPALAEPLGRDADLRLQGTEIPTRDIVLLRDHDVATAVVTALGTEGEVDVEAERLVGPPRRRGQPLGEGLGTDAFVELGGRGIGRIARAGAVVAPDQGGGEGRLHGAAR